MLAQNNKSSVHGMQNSHWLHVIDLVIHLFGLGATVTAWSECDASESTLVSVLLDTDCF